MADEKTNKAVSMLMASLHERMENYEKQRPDIEAAEELLRKRVVAGRKAGFPRHLLACGAGQDVVSAYRTGVQVRPTLEAVKRWIDSDKPFCVLLGSNGTGKSVSAAYALRLATKWVKARPEHPLADFIDVEDLCASQGLFLTAKALRHASRFPDGPNESLLDKAATVKVLVVDELRAEDFKGVGMERLEEILGERYARHLRTVITANLTAAEFAALVGPRLASRMAEGASVFESGGADMRRREVPA